MGTSKMTLSDNTGNSNTIPSQGNLGNHFSKFKSQLRADAQEFKPAFGITATNAIPNSGIYYHGMMPNYGRVIGYDGYRVNNTYYNKGTNKKQGSEPSKSSTHLNPNAQEFIPRGWVNSKNEFVATKPESQKVEQASTYVYTCSSNESESQQLENSSSLKPEKVEQIPSEPVKPLVEASTPPRNTSKASDKADHPLPDISQKSHKDSESEMDRSPHKTDQSASNPTSPIKPHSNDSSNQVTYYTFKDKLLARVSTPNSNNSNNDTSANTTVENKQNSEIVTDMASSKATEVKTSKKEARYPDNTQRHDTQNEVLEENDHSNKNTNKTNLDDSASVTKQTDSRPVSWAQRLKNSTCPPHKKANEVPSTTVVSTPPTESGPHSEKAVEKQCLAKPNPPDSSFDKSEGHSKNDLNASTKAVESKKSKERYHSPNNSKISKKESPKSGDLDEKHRSGRQDGTKEQIENKIPHADNNSKLVRNAGYLDENKEASDFENPKEEKVASNINPLYESKNFPIFILLSLRAISGEFKSLDLSFSPPELCKRSLCSKDMDRDSMHRARGGWSSNLGHTGGNKHYRDIGNYGPNSRRDRFQIHGGAQNSMGGKRIDGASAGGQNLALDWTRDERKMFRLESSAESWVVKQKEQKTKGNQFETQLRQYRAILNKLTIEKFDKLYEQILSVGINNEEEMIGLLKLVFDKATTQHHFIPMYVELCDKLRDHLKDVATIETRRILVDLCQELFVENLSEMVLPEHIQNNDEDSFEWQLKYKNKMKGNMIFMASLVRKKVIASTVVLMCMEELLQFHLPHHLEALCVFLHHVGPFLDSERWKHYEDFNTLFLQFEEFSNNNDVPIRIRFLINDVIDSRKNNWKSKNNKEGPMMLDDLKSKINAERGESGSASTKLNNPQYKQQSGPPSRVLDRSTVTDASTKHSTSTSNPWQRRSLLNHLRGLSNNNDSSKTSDNNQASSLPANLTNTDKDGPKEGVDCEASDEDNEHFIPEHIKDSLGGLMDSYVASYDLDEFFGHINDLEIPPEYFDRVYKNIFIRIAEYKLKQRNELFKALVLFSIKNKEYMSGESAKSGIKMALQPCVLDDILIDVPQFKEIVLNEFITHAVSEYDPDGQVFDSDFISQANLLLS